MNKLDSAISVVNDAINQFQPSWVFALFSGGHDSLTSSYVASLASKFDGCVHINTGIGIPATRRFVIDTCAARGWALKEYKAMENTYADGRPNPRSYEANVLEVGFPSPSHHRFMYTFLKRSQIDRMMREHPIGNVLLITGARSEESIRRMGKHSPGADKRGRAIWLNAIWDWPKSECSDLLSFANLKRNPVVLALGRSGECLCGCYAKRGELNAVEFACPKTGARLRELETRVKANGFPWGWDEPIPKWWTEKKKGQTFMLDYDKDETLIEEHLCTSCKWRAL